MQIAINTINKINTLLEIDQGSAYRGFLGQVIPHIGDAYRQGEESHRSHLGASIIGKECARAIWYSFRWATKSKFEGRMVRLFNRGHLEEARFIALLLMIGCQVYQQDAEGNQFRISDAEGHFGGSGDGVAVHVPDAPDSPCLLECKTHGEKSFIELAGKLEEWRAHVKSAGKTPFAGKGLLEAKPEHYIQMQAYMRKMGIPVGLYMAVNKNTDDIYAEIVILDTTVADSYIDRGRKIVWMGVAPEKLNSSPGYYKCRFCDHKPVCHLGAAPDRTCRSCAHSEPRKDARWHCKKHKQDIDKQTQLTGCDKYWKLDGF